MMIKMMVPLEMIIHIGIFICKYRYIEYNKINNEWQHSNLSQLDIYLNYSPQFY